MMGRNDEGGLSKYVVATIIFFITIAVWIGIALYLRLPGWVYIFIVVFGSVIAAIVVKYLEPKLEDY